MGSTLYRRGRAGYALPHAAPDAIPANLTLAARA